MILNHNGKKYKIIKTKSKITGMMFKSFKKFDGMLFEFPWNDLWGIWTPFCVKMDLIFLNNKKVVDIKHAKPWRMYWPNHKSNKLIEIKPGNDIRIGDVLEWN